MLFFSIKLELCAQNNVNESISNRKTIDSLYQEASALRKNSDWIGLIEFGDKNLAYLENPKHNFTAYQKSMITDEVVYAYIFLSDLYQVKKICLAAIEDLKKENSSQVYKEQIAQVYLSLARGYGYNEAFKESMKYLDSASFYLLNSNDEIKKFYVKNDIVSIYIELSEIDKAFELAKKCFDFFEGRPSNRGLAEVEMLLGRIYLRKKDYSKSIYFSNSSVTKTEDPRILYRSHQNLYESNKSIKEEGLALYHFELYHKYLSQIFNVKIANDKLAFEKRILEQKSEADLQIQKQKAEVQKALKNYFLVASFLITLVALTLFRSRQVLHRKNKEIAIQKTKIEDLNSGLEQKIIDRTSELQTAYDDIKNAMQKGQNIERKRIAVDLHDNLGSLLSAVSISLETLDIEGLNPHEKQLYRKIALLIDDAYAEVRSLSHNLQPADIEKGLLGEALNKLVDKLNAQSRLYIHINNELGSRVFPKGISLNVYAVVLELCNNMLKYSGAEEGQVQAYLQNQELVIKVSDEGKGLIIAKKGQGLQNVEQRIEEINGQITLVHGLQQNTEYEIRIPLDYNSIS